MDHQIYHVTTVTEGRIRMFDDLAAGRLVVKELIQSELHLRCQSLAFVVMPDHLHWMLSLAEGHCLSDVVGAVKRYSAFSINRLNNSHGSPLWQRGFHDHALRRDEDVIAVARYIVANPLRAGLVQRLGDYPLWDAMWL